MKKIIILSGLFYLLFMSAFAHGSNTSEESEEKESSSVETEPHSAQLSVIDIVQLFSGLGITITSEEVLSGAFRAKFQEYQENQQRIMDDNWKQENSQTMRVNTITSEITEKENNKKIINSFYDLLINLSEENEELGTCVFEAMEKIGQPEIDRIILQTNGQPLDDRINAIIIHAEKLQ